jgi:hypothetical protein
MTGPLQIVLGTISVLFLIVASVMAYRAVRAMVRIIRTGQPEPNRFGPVKQRLKTLVVESLGHTRMLKWSPQGAAHWFVFVGFYGLFLTLVEAFGEVWNPAFHVPLIGTWVIWNLFVDVIGTGTVLGILVLIGIRLRDHPRRKGRASRFSGSNEGRSYFVESVVLLVGLCILGIRAAKIASGLDDAPAWSHPVSGALANLLPDNPDVVSIVAFVKVVVSLVWLVVISRILNMGIAWHRFSAFPNIYFKREPEGGAGARSAAADDEQRQADRLRGPRRGRRLRSRQDRGLHLEGDAGLHHLHRVRAVPEPVPGVVHGQAAQPEDGDHGPTRSPVREGSVPAG